MFSILPVIFISRSFLNIILDIFEREDVGRNEAYLIDYSIECFKWIIMRVRGV